MDSSDEQLQPQIDAIIKRVEYLIGQSESKSHDLTDDKFKETIANLKRFLDLPSSSVLAAISEALHLGMNEDNEFEDEVDCAVVDSVETDFEELESKSEDNFDPIEDEVLESKMTENEIDNNYEVIPDISKPVTDFDPDSSGDEVDGSVAADEVSDYQVAGEECLYYCLDSSRILFDRGKELKKAIRYPCYIGVKDTKMEIVKMVWSCDRPRGKDRSTPIFGYNRKLFDRGRYEAVISSYDNVNCLCKKDSRHGYLSELSFFNSKSCESDMEGHLSSESNVFVITSQRNCIAGSCTNGGICSKFPIGYRGSIVYRGKWENSFAELCLRLVSGVGTEGVMVNLNSGGAYSSQLSKEADITSTTLSAPSSKDVHRFWLQLMIGSTVKKKGEKEQFQGYFCCHSEVYCLLNTCVHPLFISYICSHGFSQVSFGLLLQTRVEGDVGFYLYFVSTYSLFDRGNRSNGFILVDKNTEHSVYEFILIHEDQLELLFPYSDVFLFIETGYRLDGSTWIVKRAQEGFDKPLVSIECHLSSRNAESWGAQEIIKWIFQYCIHVRSEKLCLYPGISVEVSILLSKRLKPCCHNIDYNEFCDYSLTVVVLAVESHYMLLIIIKKIALRAIGGGKKVQRWPGEMLTEVVSFPILLEEAGQLRSYMVTISVGVYLLEKFLKGDLTTWFFLVHLTIRGDTQYGFQGRIKSLQLIFTIVQVTVVCIMVILWNWEFSQRLMGQGSEGNPLLASLKCQLRWDLGTVARNKWVQLNLNPNLYGVHISKYVHYDSSYCCQLESFVHQLQGAITDKEFPVWKVRNKGIPVHDGSMELKEQDHILEIQLLEIWCISSFVSVGANGLEVHYSCSRNENLQRLQLENGLVNASMIKASLTYIVVELYKWRVRIKYRFMEANGVNWGPKLDKCKMNEWFNHRHKEAVGDLIWQRTDSAMSDVGVLYLGFLQIDVVVDLIEQDYIWVTQSEMFMCNSVEKMTVGSVGQLRLLMGGVVLLCIGGGNLKGNCTSTCRALKSFILEDKDDLVGWAIELWSMYLSWAGTMSSSQWSSNHTKGTSYCKHEDHLSSCIYEEPGNNYKLLMTSLSNLITLQRENEATLVLELMKGHNLGSNGIQQVKTRPIAEDEEMRVHSHTLTANIVDASVALLDTFPSVTCTGTGAFDFGGVNTRKINSSIVSVIAMTKYGTYSPQEEGQWFVGLGVGVKKIHDTACIRQNAAANVSLTSQTYLKYFTLEDKDDLEEWVFVMTLLWATHMLKADTMYFPYKPRVVHSKHYQ